MARVSVNPPSPESLLQQSGLRRTPVRLGVLEVLARASRPLGAPEILGKLAQGDAQAVDTVTVYRTLNTFARKKLVHRVRGEDRAWRYALGDADAAPQHTHPHFICEECGKVECLADTTIPKRFLRSLGVDSAYHIRHSEVVLHGICPRCSH